MPADLVENANTSAAVASNKSIQRMDFSDPVNGGILP